MHVDRDCRDRLIRTMEQFLSEKTTAFQFDDALCDISRNNSDPTVESVADLLWSYYDDCKDHKVVLNKTEWDYIQRLMLILKSNAHIELENHTHWYPSQIAAVIALALFGFCVAWLGTGYRVLFLFVPFGIISLILTAWRERSAPRYSRQYTAIVPFDRVRELLGLRRTVCAFSKQKYPHYLRERMIRTKNESRILELKRCIVQIIGSPIWLFFQSFPGIDTVPRVKLSPEKMIQRADANAPV